MHMTAAEFMRNASARVRQFQGFVQRRIPFVLRSAMGLVFIALGVVGFLPVVGFWMIPLGLSLIWLDIGPLFRRTERDDAPPTVTDTYKKGER